MELLELLEKTNHDPDFIAEMFEFLDNLYLNYTKEQLVAAIENYYDHADDIYNKRQELNQQK